MSSKAQKEIKANKTTKNNAHKSTSNKTAGKQPITFPPKKTSDISQEPKPKQQPQDIAQCLLLQKNNFLANYH